jgi:hypothetical protein
MSTPEIPPLSTSPSRTGDGGQSRPYRLWGPLVVVGCAVLGVATVKAFGYPLDRSLFVLAVAVVLGVWLIAVAAATAAVAMVLRRRKYISAVLLSLVAVIGFASVRGFHLEMFYPYAYFQTHRAQFGAAAEFVDTVASGEGWLPPDQRGLVGGYFTVGQSPTGSRSVVLWMEVGSGIGYGFAYAPSATSGDVVLRSPATVVAVMALDDGWWWVDNPPAHAAG